MVSVNLSAVTEIQVLRPLEAIAVNNSLITEITLTCSVGIRNSAETSFNINTLLTAADLLELLTSAADKFS